MSVPKLRFNEFSSDWELKKISDFVKSLDAGVSVNSDDNVNEGPYSILKTSCVSNGFFNQKERKAVTNTHEISRLKEQLLNDSIIISRMNTPKLVGASAYVKIAPKKTYLPDRLWQVKLDSNKASMCWFSYWLNTERNHIKICDLATGTSNSMKNITKTDLLALDIFLPGPKEQTKIADFLTAVDEKITQLTQKYELLNKYKKGVMQKIFSQELRFKNDDGSEFPEWDKKKIKELTEVVVGGTPSTSNPDFWTNGTIPWISSGELNNGIIKKPIKFITQLAVKKSSAKVMPKDTTVLAMTGATLGKVGFLDFETSGNQSVAGFLPNANFYSKFLFYLLLNGKNQILMLSGGGAQQGINKGNIECLEFNFPNCKEQTKIANFLTAIDDKITATQSQLELVKQYKQGLLQQMFV